MSFTARVFGFLLVFLLSFFVFKNVAFAQTPPTNTNSDVPNNLHTWTQNVMIEVASSLTCILAGVDAVNPKAECLGIDPKTHKIGYVQNGNGLIGVIAGLIGTTLTPPIHTGDYFAYLGRNFGVTKRAYAADNAPNGVGFEGISPLLNIWTAFRNLTYLLFVVIFVVIGFAIMLRVHIDPRTVMTIENQIPKIIIALLLVTFSFAIAGFLIDLMYLGVYLVTNIFASIDTSISKDIVVMTNPIQAINTIGGIGNISGDAAGSVGNFLIPLADNFPGRALISVIFAAVVKFGGAEFLTSLITSGVGLAAIATGGVGAVPAAIGGITVGTIINIIAPIVAGGIGFAFAPQVAQGLGTIIAFLVIFIAIVFALFRLWFELLKAYVFLLIDIVFVPFWIIAGLLPGSNLSFTSWLRETGGEIIAFPATIVMLLLGRALIDQFKSASNPFVPPLIGNPAGDAIGSFIGLGIILTTPNVVNMMKGWLKAPKFDLSSIAQSLGAGVGYVGAVPRQIGGTITESREIIMKKGAVEGQASYGERGLGRAFVSKIFGR